MGIQNRPAIKQKIEAGLNLLVWVLCIIVFSSFGGCIESSDFIDSSKLNGNDRFVGDNGEHFDAQINGSQWNPVTLVLPGSSPIDFQYDFYYPGYTQYGDTNLCELVVTRYYSPSSTVYIRLDSVHGLGTYILGDSSQGSWASYSISDTVVANNRLYMTNRLQTGTVEIIQIDTSKRLVTGSVHFDALSTTDNSIVHLTNGTFVASYPY